MIWGTDASKQRVRDIAKANLLAELAKPSHPTKIEPVTVTVEVVLRDGTVAQIESFRGYR